MKKKVPNIWVISDTHFSHEMLVEREYRPPDFEQKLWRNIHAMVKPGDLFIHLGDVCIGNDAYNNEKLTTLSMGTNILVRGNHDGKSNNFYREHGWDFVCREFKDKPLSLSLMVKKMLVL